MVDIVADLHLHSKYARAVSPQMELSLMEQVALQKGIDLLATGDWTHPLWISELSNQLEESEEGLYQLKSSRARKDRVKFLFSVEIATIFSQGGKGRRIHNLVFVPSLSTAEKVNKALTKRGYNLIADGRPLIGLSSKNLLTMLLEIDERSLLIPAHAWTPWFGVYGQLSGFQSLEEAFEDMAPYVYGIETGLSSDPEMNWHMKELDTRSILSFSDAHSPTKMGREATVFRLESLNYKNMRKAIMEPSVISKSKAKQSSSIDEIATGFSNPRNDEVNKVLYTIEFYPEEGKYHYSGHRNCRVSQTPDEQRASRSVCPVCKRKVTDGVMRRVEELSTQDVGVVTTREHGVRWINHPQAIHPPFVKMIPLNEILAEALGVSVATQKVKKAYHLLIEAFGNELEILLKTPIEEIGEIVEEKRIVEGIQKVREEAIQIIPGYDGLYGIVHIWEEKDISTPLTAKESKRQMRLDL